MGGGQSAVFDHSQEKLSKSSNESEGKKIIRQIIDKLSGKFSYLLNRNIQFYKWSTKKTLKKLEGYQHYLNNCKKTQMSINNTISSDISVIGLNGGAGLKNGQGLMSLIFKKKNLTITGKFYYRTVVDINGFEKLFGLYEVCYYSNENSIIIMYFYRNIVKVIMLKTSDQSGYYNDSSDLEESFTLDSNIQALGCKNYKIYIGTFNKTLYEIDVKESLSKFKILFSTSQIQKFSINSSEEINI